MPRLDRVVEPAMFLALERRDDAFGLPIRLEHPTPERRFDVLALSGVERLAGCEDRAHRDDLAPPARSLRDERRDAGMARDEHGPERPDAVDVGVDRLLVQVLRREQELVLGAVVYPVRRAPRQDATAERHASIADLYSGPAVKAVEKRGVELVG